MIGFTCDDNFPISELPGRREELSSSASMKIASSCLKRLQESFSSIYSSLKERSIAVLRFLCDWKETLDSFALVTTYKCHRLFVGGHLLTNGNLASWALQNENFPLAFALHKIGVDLNNSACLSAIRNLPFDSLGDLSSMESILAFINLVGKIEMKFEVQRSILFSLSGNCPLDTRTAVLELLEKHGCGLTIQDAHGKTAAHHAAMSYPTFLPLLKELGADMTVEDNAGKTPGQVLINYEVRKAILDGDITRARLLKELGVNLSSQAGYNTLPHLAAKRGQEEMLELLDHQEINLKDNRGKTPAHALILAFIEWRDGSSLDPKHYFGISSPPDIEKTLRVLHRLGADFNILDNRGKAVAHYAAKFYSELLPLLKELGADMRMEDGEGKTPGQILASKATVRQAVLDGDVRQARLLKELGVNLSSQAGCDILPHLAAKRGQEEMLELLDHQEINLKDNRGETPAHALISAFVSCRNFPSIDPKHYFGISSPPDIEKTLRVLQKLGADFNIVDNQGKAVAHYAAKFYPELLPLLKELGADMTMEDGEGKTPGQILASKATVKQAVLGGDITQARLLKELGVRLSSQAGYNTLPHLAAKRGQEEMLELLDASEINLKSYLGETPAHALILAFIGWRDMPSLSGPKGHFGISSPPGIEKTLRVLQKLGADFNILDNRGKAVTHYAALFYPELLPLLKELGADMTMEDGEGKTPGQILASKATVRQAVLDGDITRVRLLKELGVNLSSQAGYNTLPHLAAKRGQEEMLELLDHQEINLKDNRGETPAHALISAFVSCRNFPSIDPKHYFGISSPPDIEKTLRVLHRLGADFNIVENRGKAVAHYAALFYPELLPLLKELGADMTMEDGEGKTPGQILVGYRYFVDDIEAPQRDGTTLAHRFAKEGKTEDLQIIAAVGANLNAKDRFGKSPVFAAVENQDIGTIETLVKLGADLNAEGEDGVALANYAFRFCNIQLTQKLHELGARFESRKKDSLTGLKIGIDSNDFLVLSPFLHSLYELDNDFFCWLQDEQGKTIAHRLQFNTLCYLWREAELPWEKCPLFVQDAQGNTGLHLISREEVFPWLGVLDPKWLEICNSEGITPLDLWGYSISLEWLRKQKVQIGAMAVNEEAFAQKVQELESAFTALWERFVFGEEEGQIPFEVFSIRLGENITTFTPDQVESALKVMIANIKNQAPMLGAPRAEERSETFSYYAFMLLHLEKIVYKLQEELEVRDAARALLMTALPQLEGRCAAAYMEEIQQMAKTVSGESCDLEISSILEKSASDALEKTIEASVAVIGYGNVHVLAALKHFFGFSPIPDPLAADYQRHIDSCQEDVERKWSLPTVLSHLNTAFHEIPMDSLTELLRDCSAGFGSAYSLLQQDALREEQQIQERTKDALLNIHLSEEQAAAVLRLLISAEGASITITPESFIAQTKQNIALHFFKFLRKNLNFSSPLLGRDIEEAFFPVRLDTEKGWDDALLVMRRKMGLRGRQIVAWGQKTKEFAQAIIYRQKLEQKLSERGIAEPQILGVLNIKWQYDQDMRKLSMDLMERSSDLSINVKAYGLASTAIEHERCLAFEIAHTKEQKIFSVVDGEEIEIGTKRVLNQKGIYLLAERLQILEYLPL